MHPHTHASAALAAQALLESCQQRAYPYGVQGRCSLQFGGYQQTKWDIIVGGGKRRNLYRPAAHEERTGHELVHELEGRSRFWIHHRHLVPAQSHVATCPGSRAVASHVREPRVRSKQPQSLLEPRPPGGHVVVLQPSQWPLAPQPQLSSRSGPTPSTDSTLTFASRTGIR